MWHPDLRRHVGHHVLEHAQLGHLLPARGANFDPGFCFLGRDDLLPAGDTFGLISLVLGHTLGHLANLVAASKGPLGRVGVSADVAAGLRHVPAGADKSRRADFVLNGRASLIRPSGPKGVLRCRRHLRLDARVILRAWRPLDVRWRHAGLGAKLGVAVVGLRVDFGLDRVCEGVLDLEVVVSDWLAQSDFFVLGKRKRRRRVELVVGPDLVLGTWTDRRGHVQLAQVLLADLVTSLVAECPHWRRRLVG